RRNAASVLNRHRVQHGARMAPVDAESSQPGSDGPGAHRICRRAMTPELAARRSENMRNLMAALATMSIGLLMAGGTTACATKKFVRTSVGEVKEKVDLLGPSVEQTQERTRTNEAKIARVGSEGPNTGTHT